jgi:hypothetical protein
MDERMKLTQGEMMVWAAEYAAVRRETIQQAPADCHRGYRGHDKMLEWEAEATVSAIEAAGIAVEAMRRALGDVRAGYDDVTVTALCDMLGVTP